MSAPLELFDLASTCSEMEWASRRDAASVSPLMKTAFSERPLKVLHLRKPFLVDLLSRFVGLFVRIGSPDFSSEAVKHLSDEMSQR
jgi:hypothetical protein